MLLKSLSVVGFKSFATRTRLDFDAGVNVVVGPNGSGKSNLLDAIAWVMGTQAASTLRTTKMDEVIFAGTASRPALGRAEVTLTFDNADRFFPLDIAELSMTRRLYRDGTSEYAINGTACRLLDLQEMLSDGGVGRHQHVLVGQGQIGDILNARPDEHRAVIEEAAGVTKHRSRRDRSVRRLEQTAIDIDRLNDILEQERRRLRPLKRQADAAERHESVRAEIRALRLWLGAEEMRSLDGRLTAATAAKATADAAVDAATVELDELVAGLDPLRVAAGEVGRALERDTAAAARLETVAERLRRISMVSRERRTALQSRIDGAEGRRRDMELEHADLAAERSALAAREAEATALAERREISLQALEDEERLLAEQAQLPAEGVVASLRGDLRSLEVASERDQRESDGIGRRREVVEARLSEEKEEAASLLAEIHQVDAQAVDAQETYEASTAVRAAAHDRLEAAEADDRAAQIAKAAAAARVEAIEGALHGLTDPEARRRAADAEGIVGTVVSRIDVPENLAAAVDGALGLWADALVAGGPESLHRAVSDLKSQGLGGITVVVGPSGEGEVPAADVAPAWGGDVLVDRLGPGADRALATRLLGDVVVVEGWDTAWRLVGKHPHLRAVTPEGDVVSVRGMRLADSDGAGYAALEAANVAHEIAVTEAARAASRLNTARRERETARQADRSALEALERLEARLGGHTEALAINGRSRAEGEAEIVRLDERGRTIAQAAAARQERIAEIRERLADFEGEERRRQEAWEALNRKRQEVARSRDEARRLREDATAALAGLVERRRLVDSRLAAVAAEMDVMDGAPVSPGTVDRLQHIEEAARDAETLVRRHIEALRERQRDLRSRVGEADGRLDAAQRRRGELERGIATGKDTVATLSIEIAESTVRRQSVAEGLRRDADTSEEEALAASRPQVEDGDLTGLLATREAELRRMGPINPLAASEYAELSTHVELLEGQLADLEQSARELRKVISALDDEMAAMFRTAFDEIDAYFQESFSLVFPGGRGRLRLTDPGDPLTSGVEIEAQPMGKKVGRLSLLSGGERSLAALAFLFAVFRARPSPFYVLDEVEAALDDSNLRRFLRLVATLRESAQLVIITHQQQTMEAADILYGVTMEPGESSKVVSKRLERRSAIQG